MHCPSAPAWPSPCPGLLGPGPGPGPTLYAQQAFLFLHFPVFSLLGPFRGGSPRRATCCPARPRPRPMSAGGIPYFPTLPYFFHFGAKVIRIQNSIVHLSYIRAPSPYLSVQFRASQQFSPDSCQSVPFPPFPTSPPFPPLHQFHTAPPRWILVQ